MAEICVHFCTQLTGLLLPDTAFSADVYSGQCQLAMHNKHHLEDVQNGELWESREWSWV